MNHDVVLYYTLLGYWLVRYLEELHPGSLKHWLSQNIKTKAFEGEIASCLGIEVPDVWSAIPAMLLGRFYTAK